MQPRKSRVSARPRRPRHFRGSNPGRRCLRRRKHHRRDARHGQGLLRASGGRVGYAVTAGCALGPCSLARLAGTPPPHADLVRGACFDLARGSSFSCFGVRPATLANLSFELVLGAVAVLHRSVPPAQAWRVPLLCIQRQQGVSTILACGCAWHVAAQLCGVVTAGDFAGYRARWTPATCGRGESAVVFDVTLRRRRFRQGKAYGPSVLVTGSAPVLNGASALTQSLTSVALTLISVRTCCVLQGEVRTLI